MLAGSGFQIVIAFHPPEAAQDITAWLGDRYPSFPQQGLDLGERMSRAFEYVFNHGCRQALLIGTDLPDLPRSVIYQGFDGIAQNGAVIGPTYDGGYYLIGFEHRNFQPAVFDEMPWGTDQVYAETAKRFNFLEKPPLVLPRWPCCAPLTWILNESTYETKSVRQLLNVDLHPFLRKKNLDTPGTRLAIDIRQLV
jgi:glycosyltransferase A (GT-A) superfamily protein (DUF2064 family)